MKCEKKKADEHLVHPFLFGAQQLFKQPHISTGTFLFVPVHFAQPL